MVVIFSFWKVFLFYEWEINVWNIENYKLDVYLCLWIVFFKIFIVCKMIFYLKYKYDSGVVVEYIKGEWYFGIVCFYCDLGRFYFGVMMGFMLLLVIVLCCIVLNCIFFFSLLFYKFI